VAQSRARRRTSSLAVARAHQAEHLEHPRSACSGRSCRASPIWRLNWKLDSTTAPAEQIESDHRAGVEGIHPSITSSAIETASSGGATPITESLGGSKATRVAGFRWAELLFKGGCGAE
jgi:hypothetical protein